MTMQQIQGGQRWRGHIGTAIIEPCEVRIGVLVELCI